MNKTRIRDNHEAAAEAAGQGQRRFRVHLAHVLDGSENHINIDAFDPEEACAIAERQQPDFDAVSADYQMGDSRMQPRDSAAFRRPARGPLISDANGGTEGLHRPGFRVESGGNEPDQWVRDGARADSQEIYDAYAKEQSEAWRSPTGVGSGELIGQRGKSECIADTRDAARPINDRRPLAQKLHDHRRKMQTLYDNIKDETENAWRAK